MAERSEDLGALIELYALGQLDEEKVPEVESYLRDNPGAQAEFEEMRNIISAVAAGEMETPSPALSASVKRRVHSIMARKSGRRAESVWQSIAGLFARPAIAATAVVIAACICIGAVLLLRTPTEKEDEQPAVVEEEQEITAIEKAAAAAYEFGPFVEQTKEIFEEILWSDAGDIREILKDRKLDTFVGRAWSLRENEEGPKRELLLDVEDVWRLLMEFAAGDDETLAEKARKAIIDKRIIQRSSEALSGE